MKNKVIFIGAIDRGNIATNGETMKNQILLKRFESLFDKVVPVDTYQWRKRPWCFLQMIGALMGNRGAKVVVSASGAASFLFTFLYYIPLKRNVYDWVIGGNRAEKIRKGVYSIKVLKKLEKIIVEGESMVKELNALGLDNVLCVPNFKQIDFTPSSEKNKDNNLFRFVFLSRMHPAKGIEEILDACILLNKQGYSNLYSIDFYGAFDTDYKDRFLSYIKPLQNVEYRGFLNLMGKKGYEDLSKYDVLLFPTYWDGEGFPGIVIDAYMAGLPIIASDWNMNKEVVKDGETGFIIPVHDVKSLATQMKSFIDGEIDLSDMRAKCLEHVKKYDYRNVVTKELLINIGLITE